MSPSRSVRGLYQVCMVTTTHWCAVMGWHHPPCHRSVHGALRWGWRRRHRWVRFWWGIAACALWEPLCKHKSNIKAKGNPSIGKAKRKGKAQPKGKANVNGSADGQDQAQPLRARFFKWCWLQQWQWMELHPTRPTHGRTWFTSCQIPTEAIGGKRPREEHSPLEALCGVDQVL